MALQNTVLFYSKIWCMVIKVINRLNNRMIIALSSYCSAFHWIVPVNKIWQVQHKQVISVLLHCTLKSYFDIWNSASRAAFTSLSRPLLAPQHLKWLILWVIFLHWSLLDLCFFTTLWIFILAVDIQCNPYLYLSCFSM